MRHAHPVRILVLTIATLAILSSLAPAMAQATPSGMTVAKGTVVIYRPASMLASTSHPVVLIEGKPLIETINGSLWKADFAPGKYKFEMKDKKSAVELEVVAGTTYYLKVDLGQQAWSGGGHISQVPEDQAMKESKNIDPLPEKYVKHKGFKKQ